MIGWGDKLADWFTGVVTVVALAGVVWAMTSSPSPPPDPTPSPYPTVEPTATATPAPTRTLMDTPTVVIGNDEWFTPEATPLELEPTVLCDSVGLWCLVRAGPGKEYEVVTRYPPGANLLLDDLNPGSDWYVVELPDGSLAYASKEVWR